MDKSFTEYGDEIIVYKANEFGEVSEKPKICAMCNLQVALYIARETQEPLCKNCYINNLEAREKKTNF